MRLSGLDSAFVSLESPTTHLHVLGVLVLDPKDVPGGLTFRQIRSLIGSRVPSVAPFRQRLVDGTLGLQHPILVDDPEFDLEYHVRRHHLPDPGGHRELCDLVGTLAGRPLDRTRPLWEFHVVEGLADGKLAVVAKVHHAIIDGVAGAEVLGAFLDGSPIPAPRPLFSTPRVPRTRPGADDARPVEVRESSGWDPEPLPGEVDQLRRALAAVPGRIESLARSVVQTVQMVQSAQAERSTLDGADPVGEHRGITTPNAFDAPHTSLNRAISGHRRVAVVDLSLSDVRLIGSTLGGTVNDVVLATVAGGLQRYFEARHEDPDSSLVAMVPISVRSEDERGALGNRVTASLVSLATGVGDPVARLHRISRGMQAAKDRPELLAGSLLTAWAEAVSPGVARGLSRLVSGLRLFDHLRPPCNLVVSNVPGPETPLYLAGARLEALYPFGPIAEGVGLNVTVFSYEDTIHVGLMGCWDLIPDIADLGDDLTSALAELVTAARRQGRPVPWWHADLA